ncbi:MAG: alpha/beta hydrolase [Luteolibacter sp.]|uniref:alpha/beta hydrolase n=1 Tax=Luteolibacter sp. TaxID=1962973 RepID=UPI00326740E4
MQRIAFLIVALLTPLASGEWVNLWPSEAPGAKPLAAGSEKTGDGGRMSDIEIPQYEAYFPEKEKATGAAALIFPGGGYGILAADHEGRDYAKWLNERGIAGIVVKYRVSGNPASGYQFPVPFLDARRAIRTARAKASEWGIDPKKVGVMGSSAGGHLASLCATRFADTFPEEGKDAIDKENCRPDFAILLYPVISMSPPLAHTGSRKNLLGDNPSPEAVEKYSTQKAVTKDTPPVFLVSTSDDPIDCRNSLEFAVACKANNVPVSLHLFETGGHGYGLKGKGNLAAWPLLLEQWLAVRFPAGK